MEMMSGPSVVINLIALSLSSDLTIELSGAGIMPVGQVSGMRNLEVE